MDAFGEILIVQYLYDFVNELVILAWYYCILFESISP